MMRPSSNSYDRLSVEQRAEALRNIATQAVLVDGERVLIASKKFIPADRVTYGREVTTAAQVRHDVEHHPAAYGIDSEVTVAEQFARLKKALRKMAPAEPARVGRERRPAEPLAREFARYVSHPSGWQVTTKLGLVGIIPQALGLLPLSGPEHGILRALWAVTSAETLTVERSEATVADESGFGERTVRAAIGRNGRLRKLGLMRVLKEGQKNIGPSVYAMVPPKHWPKERHEEMKAALRVRLARRRGDSQPAAGAA